MWYIVLGVVVVIGWGLAVWFWIDLKRRVALFGDLIVDPESSEVFLHCPHQPEELLEHRYITLKIINLNREYARK